MMSHAFLVLVGQLTVAILGGGVAVAVINSFMSVKVQAEARVRVEPDLDEDGLHATLDYLLLAELETECGIPIADVIRQAEAKAEHADTLRGRIDQPALETETA